MKISHNNFSKQSGYTLLELLISATIGIIILITVLQIYLSASRTNQFQSGVIEIQDSGRFVLAMLERDLQRAGWTNLGSSGAELGTLDSHIDFTQTTNGSGFNNSDSITIRYEADYEDGVDVEFDCSGAAIAEGEVITNQYAVVNGELQCNGSTIISNIESMQILYGVENPVVLSDGMVDGYVRADQITNYESLVSTVRIGLIINSTDEILDDVNANRFQVLDEIFPAQNDRRLRRTFTKTVLLPNRPQAF